MRTEKCSCVAASVGRVVDLVNVDACHLLLRGQKIKLREWMRGLVGADGEGDASVTVSASRLYNVKEGADTV